MRITNTNELHNHAVKMLVFGISGAGKTTLAKTIKGKVLILSAENGLLSLKGTSIDVLDLSKDDQGVMIPKEGRTARLIEAYMYLLEPETMKKYDYVFIDSITEICQCLYNELCLAYPEKKDSLVKFGELGDRMMSLIKSFRDLPHYSVIFTALAIEEKDENSRRCLTIDLIGKISKKINGLLDEVFYLYVHENEDKTRKRVLLTDHTDKVKAKDRSGSLDLIEDADLSIVMDKIRFKTQTKKAIIA